MSIETISRATPSLTGPQGHLGRYMPTMVCLAIAVILLAPELPIGEASTISLGGFLLALAWLGAFFRRPPWLWRLHSTSVHLLVPIYALGVSLIRYFNGEMPDLIFLAALQWAVYASYFLLPGAFGSRDRKSFLQFFLPLSLAIYAVITIWTAFQGPAYTSIQRETHRLAGAPLFRAVGTGENPNATAVTLVTALGAPLFLWRPRSSLLKWLLVGLVVLALLLTASRAGLLALGAATIGCLLLHLRAKGRHAWAPLLLIFVAVAIATYITLRVSPYHAVREFGAGEFSFVEEAALRSTVLWSRAVNVFLDGAPLDQLVGRGFRNTSGVYYEGGVASYGSYHNAWLQFLLDLGVIGTLLLLWWIIVVLVRAIRRGANGIGLASIWMLLSLITASTTENFLYGPQSALFLGLATWLVYMPAGQASRRKSAKTHGRPLRGILSKNNC